VFIYGFCIRGRSRDGGDGGSLRILDYRQAIVDVVVEGTGKSEYFQMR
jgi:hypothetical protein